MSLKRKKGCVLLLDVLLLFSFLCLPAAGAEENAEEVVLEEELPEEESSDSTESEEPSSPTPRDAFIDDIIAAGKEVYDKADGKYKRAHYKNDIYVCKNFTVYVFKQARSKYRMAEFPDTELRIPNNLSAKQCRPYNYGYCWEEIPASKGKVPTVRSLSLITIRRPTLSGPWTATAPANGSTASATAKSSLIPR